MRMFRKIVTIVIVLCLVQSSLCISASEEHYNTRVRFTSIAAGGNHSVALSQNGYVYSWGDNSIGQLGDGTLKNRALPSKVEGLGDIIEISAGGTGTAALSQHGKVYIWGNNIVRPRVVVGLTNIKKISVYDDRLLALDDKGEVYNQYRELLVNDVINISSNSYSSCVQLRDGTSLHTSYFLKQSNDKSKWFSMPEGNIKDISMSLDLNYNRFRMGWGGSRTVSEGSVNILLNEGIVKNFGISEYESETPVPVVDRQNVINGLTDITAVSKGKGFGIALKSDGTVYSWGTNKEGQLGDGAGGTGNYKNEPINVNGLSGIEFISAGDSHCLALSKNGTVYAWGNNDSGQLGNGLESYSKKPVPVKGISDIIAVSSGLEHTVALKSDGSVWTWGNNNYCQLGDKSTKENSIPSKVLGLPSIIDIAAGKNFTMAVSSDGRLWSWGNWPEKEACAIPVEVNGINNLKWVAAGSGNVIVVKNDGTVWKHDDYEKAFKKIEGLNNLRSIVFSIGGTTGGLLETASFMDLDGNTYSIGDRIRTFEKESFWPEINKVTNNGVKLDKTRLEKVIYPDSFTLDKYGYVWITKLNEPQKVTGIDNIVELCRNFDLDREHSVVTRGHFVALGNNGNVYTWGSNNFGQLGINNNSGLRPRAINIEGLNEYQSTLGSETSLAYTDIIILQVNNENMYVNGVNKWVDADSGGDFNKLVKPVIINGRVFLPARAVIEAMGGEVLWNDTDKLVTANKGSNEIKLWVDKKLIYVNGAEKEIDVAPQIMNNRLMVPIRVISENMGAEVNWDSESQRVIILTH